jgi:hypothetical protein
MSLATEIAVIWGGAGEGEQQHPGGEEVDVAVASPARGDPIAERPTEDVDEQQQDDDGHEDRKQRQAGVAMEVAQVAPQHRARVAHGVGSGHGEDS